MTDFGNSETSLLALLAACSDPVVLVDPSTGRIVERNPAFDDVLCPASATETAQLVDDFLPDLATDPYRQELLHLATGQIIDAQFETEVTMNAGRSAPAYAVMRRIEFHGQSLVGIVIRVQSNEPIYHTRRDPLTALPDRSALLERLELLLEGERCEDHDFAVLFVDLNEFKPINDQWGHLVGDRLIAEVAHRLSECLRTGDTLVRYGGDEFVALLEGAAGEDDYLPVVERMHQALAEPFPLPDGSDATIAASIGAADSSGPWRTPVELIDAADRAMYQAKRLQSEAQ